MILLLSSAGCGRSTPVDAAAEEAALIKRAGAPLFKGMGDYHRPITTRDAGAQRYFDQGMVLAFGFNHAEAIRSFRAAQRLDPQCAMCAWGEALATGPNINVTSKGKVTMSPADRKAAYAAAHEAIRHFQAAVTTQDSLPYMEPPFWYYPTRQSLRATLMQANRFAEAEAVYRKDLEAYPHNGWSIFGLSQSLARSARQARRPRPAGCSSTSGNAPT
jgi:tetratricopeptide (TPR) repeat protein